MRSAAWLMVVLGVSGCLSQSHRLLSAEDGRDGGSSEEDAAPTGPLWTTCDPLVEGVGQHMDACAFGEGTACYSVEPGKRVAMCLDGRVLLGMDEPLGLPMEVSGCTGSVDTGTALVEIVSVAAGCVEVEVCESEGTFLRRSRSCQQPPLPGVRDEAVGTTPWPSCDAAAQSGTDGDPCSGEFRCVAQRRYSASSASNQMFVACDGGVLRMLPAIRVLHGGAD